MYSKAIHPMALLAAAAAMVLSAPPAGASETDDRIEASFKQSYVYREYLRDDTVKVEAKHGVVTLTGTVVDESHKALAAETAANLPGVKRVDNQLQTKAEVAAESADTWTARKIKLALLFHKNVDAGKTTIEVREGVVTLKGEASSAAQKELTAEYANDIDSVKAVKNEMTVAAVPRSPERTAGTQVDDASVTAQVKTALLTHRSTRSVKTTVKTRNGEVTLTGIASNAAEKALVTKLVSDIQGVTSVKNQMTVAEAGSK